MDHATFEARVHRLQEAARENPENYRIRVLLVTLLGYGYILVVLGLLLFGIATVVAGIVMASASLVLFKLVVPLAVVVFVVFRSLWVRFDAPRGVRLRRDRLPGLFGLIDHLVERTRAPRPHEVLLVEDFNAAVVQNPRLGFLGWPRNYVLIGLPMLHALPPEEFKAVLAHEFGHLAGSHGKFGAWIYSQRATWSRLFQELEGRSRLGSFFFRGFARWYGPIFNSYTFVLARTQEYEADGVSAELAGSRTAADALLRVDLRVRQLNESFWPEVNREVGREPSPVANLYTRMRKSMREMPGSAETWLKQNLQAETGVEDTHPALKDRLEALGEEARIPGPVKEAAASSYLGGELTELENTLNRIWSIRVQEQWTAGHEAIRKRRDQLAALDAEREHRELDLKESWRRLLLLLEFDEERALGAGREILERVPDHGSAHSLVGQLLLARGDEAGIAHIERSLESMPHHTVPALLRIMAFCQEAGRADDAARAEERLEAFSRQVESAAREREDLPLKFDPVTLREWQRSLWEISFDRHPDIRRVYVAKFRVVEMPEMPFYVLGVRMRRGRKPTIPAERIEELKNWIHGEFDRPLGIGVLMLDAVPEEAAEDFFQAAGDPIYDRPEPGLQYHSGSGKH